MSKVNLISQAEYAKHRGVSGAAVCNAVKAGRISLIDGKIDPVAADAQWAQNSRVRAGSRPAREAGATTAELAAADGTVASGAEPGAEDYWVSRGRREAAEARSAELDLAQREGELIEVKAVETVWATAMAGVREHLLQLRARLSPMLAAESDPFKVDQMLDEEHAQALAQLAGVQVAGRGSA